MIRHKDNIGTAQKFGVLWFPFACASRIACRSNIPRPKQIGFWFAFNNENRMIGGKCFDQFRQTINYDRDTLDVPYPLARTIRIGALLPIFLFGLPPLRVGDSRRSTTNRVFPSSS
jgi:hypothetical protein